MTWKLDRHVLERKKSGQSDSIVEARAAFLSSILNLHPQVASDLWTRALVVFSFAAAKIFERDLLPEQEQTADSGRWVLSQLFLDAMRKFEADEQSQMNEKKALCSTFGRFRVLNAAQLEGAFPDWASLTNSEEAVIVSKSIDEWSIHWNLDSEWCRNHSLNVLREWLADEALRWAFLSPSMNPQIERRGWQRAVSGTLWQLQWSRVRDALIIFENLNPFEFRWRGSRFETQGWDYLKDKEADWRRRTRVRFSIWLSETELEKIGPLREGVALDELTPMEVGRRLAWRNGALSKFNNSLRDYLRRLNVTRQAAKSRHGLVEVTEKPKLLQHIEWAVRYQVASQNLSQIGSTFPGSESGVEPSTVSRAVDEVLSLIRLQKRPDAKPGRIPGRKNKQPKVLRDLGR